MPRQSRVDTPGALHHIMARGIEGEDIFRNDDDNDHFLERLEKILKETETSCYAWALIPNHFHLLLRTGPIPISTVMGKVKNNWQDINAVLVMFGEKLSSARRAYRSFIKKGMGEGKRQDLTGGGLLRSAGGWEGVKSLRDEKVYQRNDERILGDGDFVSQILSSAEDEMKKEYALRSLGIDLNSIAARVSEVLDIKIKDVWAKGKYKRIVEARSLLCYWAVRELGVSMSKLSKKVGDINSPCT